MVRKSGKLSTKSRKIGTLAYSVLTLHPPLYSVVYILFKSICVIYRIPNTDEQAYGEIKQIFEEKSFCLTKVSSTNVLASKCLVRNNAMVHVYVVSLDSLKRYYLLTAT